MRPLLILCRLVPLLFLLALAGCRDPVVAQEKAPETGYDGFQVAGRHLYDPCGERVVLRGVNKMTVWTDRDGVPSFREIAKTGANVVRIMWDSSVPAEQFDETLSEAVEQGLISIIELHDATGEWDRLDEMVDYWVRPSTVEVLFRHEDHVIVNVANEAGDSDVTDEQYKEGYTRALQRMREAGIPAPILIDAAGWGRDVQQLLRSAPYLMRQDPRENVLFSVHWWHSDNDKQRITDALTEAVEKEIPLIVGEFAHKEVGCEGRIAYDHLIEEAERLHIGWLAWSWGPGNSDCAEMDMTEDGTFETLHGWGQEVAVTDSFSIQNTSERSQSITKGRCE